MGNALDPHEVRRIVRRLLEGGLVTFSRHASEEMAKDDLDASDCLNVLRAGAVDINSLVGDCWRYTVETNRIAVVIALRGEAEIVIVTAWRKGR